ncbi:permease prefix domain 1-containing protein [Microbacterium sp.]|uniref:permease prefix domain 1-containing protein n=1 Tax=Microbacterium sp. TaxID=51671 RepID=UPI0025E54693|nr:permease prefix domain 1-containing protein [Microbacterium sp.]
MTATLTDRYIDAVIRTLPERQRADVAQELGAAIADQLDARIESGEPADAAERRVLIDLGDPDRLAAGYADRPLHLIGPRSYLAWKRLLVLLLWIVPACAAVGVGTAELISGAGVGELIGAIVPVVISVIVHVCFWVTLVFAVIERTGHQLLDTTPWTPDSLPDVRVSGARLSDLVGGLVFLALLAGALVWDLLRGFAFVDGAWIPFLNPALWPGWVVVLVVLILVEVALTTSAFRVGRWTMPLAAMNAALAVVSASVLLWLLGGGMLVNPALIDLAISSGADADLTRVLGAIVAVSIVCVSLWDIVDGFRKARR